MDLKINQQHVNEGTRDTNDRCPTALALRAAGFAEAQVTTVPAKIRVAIKTGTLVGAGIRWEACKLPKSLCSAINDFDAGKPFRIGTYRIPGLKRPKA